MKRYSFILLSISLLLLSGCLFPDDQRAENRIAYPDQLQSVQHAVEQFQTDTGVLPIRTFDETTSLYQRYIIDFNQLVPRYLQQPPGTAFENGGVFQYVLVNVEEQPEIKVIDLTSQREIQQLQQRLNDYMRQHRFAPIEEMLDVGLFKLDHEALNYKEAPHVRSPYHDTYLPLLLTNDGEIIIDYRIDLNMMLNEYDHSFEEGDDIRSLLYEHTPFVPLRSVPYVLDENGEPTYAMELR
ncbi:hypothetical protein [Halalkalibacter alkaliphilus]|uniref:ABC transporter periplasmic binding protein yphF n=1 Tax=Halalkalibacter alkaliphilus TaxID=2917993 RepID=A0A9X1ZZH0_9BACI|nr:hypothetical protein [Halalkalibacter alkaliphilus]MCL7745900.1 hypothetical protein [Halalkalibacter alkaliphilus]